ncbi:MAG TPA: acetyl-CoA carboxylase biotin carboxyl carrier protein subunit [Mucilaginibacter sp.]|jgi:biotin carboxyl carrier protein|nr:acetyl-CoA carboxylase biotin carboxyl carrier protein subunit [Mucilaginibacter sp.]
MYRIKVNNQYDFETDRKEDTPVINGAKVAADVRLLNASCWHIISNRKSYNVEVVSFSASEKNAQIKVNNNLYTVAAKDQFDVLLDQLGLSTLNGTRISELKAPMPGMVLKVFVCEGSEVKKGDNILVLEAMKMENIIKAAADVLVKSIKIKPGDKVEKNQILMLF